jgi:predicted DNA-binding transcriptional regulator AlpA
MNDVSALCERSDGEAALVAVRLFCRRYDIDRSTAWRFEQIGWLPQPVHIGRRAYYPAAGVREFERRAIAGELSGLIKPPSRRL